MIDQFIWPGTVLIIFLGMLWVVLKALGIAHDLAKTVLQQGVRVPVPVAPTPSAPVAPTPHTMAPTPQPPISTQPVDVVDQGLVAFIKKEEGFTPKATWDYKQYSNGYGTKANSSTEVITEPEATARLTVEVDAAYKLVQKVIPTGTSVGIVQALTDLTYNAGPGWETQSLGAAVKAAKWDTVKADILLYNHAGGAVLPALTKRRESEVSWFDNPL